LVVNIFKRENVRHLLIRAGSAIFALLVLELLGLGRILDYRSLIGLAPHDVFADSNRDDPELLHIHPPHSHFSGAAPGGNFSANFQIPPSDMTTYRWDVNYDYHGFRNDVDLKNADMIVIGDSMVESIVTPTAQLTTSVLATLQGKVVANLGQYGYGPREELAVLKRYGLPLQPRTVVWTFFEGSGLRDVIHYDQVKVEQGKPPSPWSAFWQRSFTKNALVRLRVEFRRVFRPSGAKRSAVVEAPNGEKRTTYFLYSSQPLSRQDLGALDQTVLILATAHQLCAAQGARLILVFVPTKFRVYHPFCRFPPESECRQWGLSDLPERLQRAVESISPEMGYLDLTPDLADAVKRGELPYYSDDDHWSLEGQRIAAEAINDYLSSKGGGTR
jgi:acetyltransferase AlgX (SGNH hydrolase-like protein)